MTNLPAEAGGTISFSWDGRFAAFIVGRARDVLQTWRGSLSEIGLDERPLVWLLLMVNTTALETRSTRTMTVETRKDVREMRRLAFGLLSTGFCVVGDSAIVIVPHLGQNLASPGMFLPQLEQNTATLPSSALTAQHKPTLDTEDQPKSSALSQLMVAQFARKVARVFTSVRPTAIYKQLESFSTARSAIRLLNSARRYSTAPPFKPPVGDCGRPRVQGFFWGYSQQMSERPSITYEGRYIGAEITEWVFITFAVLWFFSGLITIVLTAHHRYVTGTGLSMTLLIAIEVIATLLGTAMFAFFGFVLDLLRGIWEETAGEND